MTQQSTIKIWRTLEISGEITRLEYFLHVVSSTGHYVDPWIKRTIMANRNIFSEQKNGTYNLSLCSLNQIGFTRRATNREIREWVVANGYLICPAILGLYLRLSYYDQDINSTLLLVMESICCDSKQPTIMHLGRGSGNVSYLGGAGGYDEDSFDPRNTIVFVHSYQAC